MAGDPPASHNVDRGHPVDDPPYVDDSDNVYDNDAKYNIYAKQLFPLRHGYPLMSPASTDHTGELVTPQIGDVGCLQEGEFIRFFNATAVPESDTRADRQKSSGIPDGLEPFPAHQFVLREPERAFKSHLCSDSVRLVESESQAVPDQGDSATQESTTSFTFECSQNAGAFVRIGDGPATSSDILLSRGFVPFMQANIERWYQHIINNLDFDTAPQRIVFVSGVTRAADWFTGAFSAKGREIVFSETRMPGSAAAFKPREIHRQHIHDVECNDQRRNRKQGTAAPVTEEGGGAKLLEEQTLFFHYYKMKSRSWLSDEDDYGCGDELEHEYPSPEDSNLDEHEREWDVTQEPLADQAVYDPVDYLLDYILDYPMEMAIASDLHIYALFPDGKVPLDIKEELYKLRPEVIFVHEEVACLAVAQWAAECSGLTGSQAKSLNEPSQEDPPASLPVSNTTETLAEEPKGDPESNRS